MPQCDCCARHAPCVTGPLNTIVGETYACCRCRWENPWTPGESCENCEENNELLNLIQQLTHETGKEPKQMLLDEGVAKARIDEVFEDVGLEDCNNEVTL